MQPEKLFYKSASRTMERLTYQIQTFVAWILNMCWFAKLLGNYGRVIVYHGPEFKNNKDQYCKWFTATGVRNILISLSLLAFLRAWAEAFIHLFWTLSWSKILPRPRPSILHLKFQRVVRENNHNSHNWKLGTGVYILNINLFKLFVLFWTDWTS